MAAIITKVDDKYYINEYPITKNGRGRECTLDEIMAIISTPEEGENEETNFRKRCFNSIFTK